jgi:hypothetical protein
VLLKLVRISDQDITLSRTDDSACWFSDLANQRETEERRAHQRERVRNQLRAWFAKGRIGNFHPTNFSDDQQPQESPERALWAAILERALLDVRGNVKPTGREDRIGLQSEAVEWLNSSSIEPGSFRFCCEVLDLSPAAILESVAQGTQTATA